MFGLYFALDVVFFSSTQERFLALLLFVLFAKMLTIRANFWSNTDTFLKKIGRERTQAISFNAVKMYDI